MLKESMLLNAIGYAVENRIIDFLIGGKGMDYSKKGLAEKCGISRPTLYKVLASLVKKGVARPTRKIGIIQLYAINEENDRVKALLKLEEFLLKESFEALKEKVKTKAQTA